MTTYQNLESKYTPPNSNLLYIPNTQHKNLWGNHHIFNPYDKVGIVCHHLHIYIYICCFIFTHLHHTIIYHILQTIYPLQSPKNCLPGFQETPSQPSTSPLLEKTFRDSTRQPNPRRLVLNFMSWSNFEIPPPMLGPMGRMEITGVGMVGCTSRKLIGKLDCMICLMISQLT